MVHNPPTRPFCLSVFFFTLLFFLSFSFLLFLFPPFIVLFMYHWLGCQGAPTRYKGNGLNIIIIISELSWCARARTTKVRLEVWACF